MDFPCRRQRGKRVSTSSQEQSTTLPSSLLASASLLAQKSLPPCAHPASSFKPLPNPHLCRVAFLRIPINFPPPEMKKNARLNVRNLANGHMHIWRLKIPEEVCEGLPVNLDNAGPIQWKQLPMFAGWIFFFWNNCSRHIIGPVPDPVPL